MNKTYIYSGKCRLCEIGIAGYCYDLNGNSIEIHTGDIVIVWGGRYVGTDIEEWTPHGLTAIVAEQFRTYTNGSYEELPLPIKPFAMGIKCAMDEPESWRVQVVKKYMYVVDGENWPEYGFSYKVEE